MLRTEFALLGPETLEQLGIRLLEAPEFEMELLNVVGYSWLAATRSISP